MSREEQLRKFEQLKERRRENEAIPSSSRNLKKIRREKRNQKKERKICEVHDVPLARYHHRLKDLDHSINVISEHSKRKQNHHINLVEHAISQGDIKQAVQWNDEILEQDREQRILKAVTVRDGVLLEEKESELQQRKKKPRLYWGFEAKQRWEAKGNM